MRYKALFSLLCLAVSNVGNAHWEKINDVDYTWGPFKIYNISLFTETGEYKKQTRPVMLTLDYSKPVDGRDFAISVAKSWGNLGFKFSNQDEILDKLRKTLPDLKPNDKLSYIALEDRGYFVLNDQVVNLIFEKEFNDAMLAIWLGSKTDISRQLTTKKIEGTAQEVHYSDDYTPYKVEKAAELKDEPTTNELKDMPAVTQQAVDSDENFAKSEVIETKHGDLKETELSANVNKKQELAKEILAKSRAATIALEDKSTVAEPDSKQAPMKADESLEKDKTPQSATPSDVKSEDAKKAETEDPEKDILPIYDAILDWQRLKLVA